MSEITDRLRTATDECLTRFEAWNKDKTDGKAREVMLDSLHELRKAAARLEIEMAISERDRLGNNPIPIPTHKSSKRSYQKNDGGKSGGKGRGGKPRSDNKKPDDGDTSKAAS